MRLLNNNNDYNRTSSCNNNNNDTTDKQLLKKIYVYTFPTTNRKRNNDHTWFTVTFATRMGRL